MESVDNNDVKTALSEIMVNCTKFSLISSVERTGQQNSTRTILKDNSKAGIIVDYSKDYTIVNGVVLIANFLFQSAKKCKMTSSYMTSLQGDLNEAAKCVDIIPLTLLASL